MASLSVYENIDVPRHWIHLDKLASVRPVNFLSKLQNISLQRLPLSSSHCLCLMHLIFYLCLLHADQTYQFITWASVMWAAIFPSSLSVRAPVHPACKFFLSVNICELTWMYAVLLSLFFISCAPKLNGQTSCSSVTQRIVFSDIHSVSQTGISWNS